jgi:hypothetical protein
MAFYDDAIVAKFYDGCKEGNFGYIRDNLDFATATNTLLKNLLRLSIEHKHMIVVKYLMSAIKQRDIQDLLDTSLNHAIVCKNYDMVVYVVSMVANIYSWGDNFIRVVVGSGNEELFKLRMFYSPKIHTNKETLICDAAKVGNLVIFKMLISAGANIATHEHLPLFIAVKHNNLGIVKYIVQYCTIPKLIRVKAVHLALKECGGGAVARYLQRGFRV